MVPINYKFVTYQTLSIVQNGETQSLTILVLDESANDAYWKLINSFPELLKQQDLAGPEQATAWHISTAFAGKEAYQDIVRDIENDPYFNTQESFKIYGIPVKYIEDEVSFCVLELADGKLVENELWE